MYKLEIGKKCFVNGKVGKIVAQDSITKWVVMYDKPFNSFSIAAGECAAVSDNCCLHNGTKEAINFDRAFVVNKLDCEPLATELFAVGDSIKSLLINGGLVGTITSFEQSTNRVVCVSDRIKAYHEERTRYAYKINEIEKFDPNAYTFILGSRYKINNKVTVTAIEDPTEESFVLLVDNNGRIAYRDVPRNARLDGLKMIYDIFNIQKVS
jgi:hypothetical protein